MALQGQEKILDLKSASPQSVELSAENAGVNLCRIITEIVNRLQVRHMLSYGYGTGWLMEHFRPNHPLKVQTYDKNKGDSPPIPAQFVVCIDVLGYDDTETVLADTERLTEAVLFANVRLKGDETIETWLPRFWSRFDIHTFQVTAKDEFFVVCYARPKFVDRQ